MDHGDFKGNTGWKNGDNKWIFVNLKEVMGENGDISIRWRETRATWGKRVNSCGRIVKKIIGENV